MKEFAHKNIVGTFFDVLAEPLPDATTEGLTAKTGTTLRQDAVLCALAGDLDLEHVPELASSLRGLLTNAVRVIVLDLSRVQEFCPNAVSILVNFVSFVEGGGKRMVLYRPSARVRKTLATLNLTHLFEVCATEDDLLLLIPD